jgi:signal transduction histidine kinase
MTEQREFYLWRQRLDGRLQEWEEKGQDEGALLRGAPLTEAEQWLTERPDDLSADERAYIRKGITLRARELAEEEQRRQRELEQERKLRQFVEKELVARRELARELHDRAGGKLTAVLLHLEIVRALLQKEHPIDEIEKELLECGELARGALQGFMRALYAMPTVVLETQGLTGALNQYATRMRQIDAPHIDIDIEGYEGQLGREAEAVVLSIIEEAVDNAKKYARVNQVLVRLRVKRHVFIAEIQDDGTGFDAEKVQERLEATNDIGLLAFTNIERRIQWTGGTCSIQSQPGGGTVVRLEIPL